MYAPVASGQQPDGRDAVKAPHLLQGVAAGVEHQGEIHEDVAGDDQHGVEGAGVRAVTALQVLRHGRDAVADVERDEDQQQDRQGREDHPFPVHHGHAELVGVPDLADELLGTDSRRDDGGPDGVPGQAVAGAKVLLNGRLLSSGYGEADNQHDHDVPEEENRVEQSEHSTQPCLRSPTSIVTSIR